MESKELQDWLGRKLRNSDFTLNEMSELSDLSIHTISLIMREKSREIRLSTFIKLHKVVTGQYPIIVETPNVRHLRKIKANTNLPNTEKQDTN